MPEIDFLKDGTPEANDFPAAGHTFEADLGGDILVQFEYHSVNSMTIHGMKGEHKGFTETVEIRVTPVREGVYMVGWQEKNQTTVTHIEDFERGILYSNITLPGNRSLRLQGAFHKVK